jgi:hypothetical protein
MNESTRQVLINQLNLNLETLNDLAKDMSETPEGRILRDRINLAFKLSRRLAGQTHSVIHYEAYVYTGTKEECVKFFKKQMCQEEYTIVDLSTGRAITLTN